MKHYRMVDDRMLREQPGHDTLPRFPTFSFIGERNKVGHTINPYLVILAAEIKFWRYLAANGPPSGLWRPYAENYYGSRVALIRTCRYPICFLRPRTNWYGGISLYGWGYRFGDGPPDWYQRESGGPIARHQRRTAGGDGGGETRRADADYWRHMLSGRSRFQNIFLDILSDYDYPLLVDLALDNDDLDVLRDIEESNRANMAKYGWTLRYWQYWHFIAASTQGQSLEQVEIWSETIEAYYCFMASVCLLVKW